MHPFDALNPLHLALFSGKGGVGKTTLSCAFAYHWARQFPQENILLLSTDPAHSLGDMLQMTVTDTPQPVVGFSNLQVRSLDAEKLLQSFRQQYGQVLELLVERGSFVQGDDLSPVWDLGWPGLDELMGVLEIQRLLRDQDADRVVVDMAPSGHTLNLLGLMDFLDSFLNALALFQEKHQAISQSFTGHYIEDVADVFLVEMKADLATGRQLLQDADRTGCIVVAIAEPMSYLETRRFLKSLQTLHIPCSGVLLNRILPSSLPTSPTRLSEQHQMLHQFLALPDVPLVFTVPLQPQEPIGSAALYAVLSQLQSAEAIVTDAVFSPTPIVFPDKVLPSCSDFIRDGRRLILVGGKGGVGKTTISAAIAWAMAEQHPDREIRVISIDPAHSLGDALGMTLSHDPVLLTANLSGQEIDAKRVLDQFRADYLWELAAMMSGDPGAEALQIAYGPEAWRQIVNQALPGIDEMLSLIAIVELLEQGKQDLIVLDTAPTGHLLRFLEMPTALADWLSWIFKLWIKYQAVVGRTEFMGRLRILRQRVMQAQKKLKDPAHTEFVGVVQAQSAILAEAERLSHSLSDLGISQRYLIHNRYTSDQFLSNKQFPSQTIVRLPELPRTIDPLLQIQGAAQLLF